MQLYNLVDKYCDPNYECPYDDTQSDRCACNLLGALTRGMRSMGLSMPRPEIPFEGLSLEGLCGKIPEISSPTLTTRLTTRTPVKRGTHGYRDIVEQECNLTETVTALTEVSRKSLRGLELKQAYTRVPLEM